MVDASNTGAASLVEKIARKVNVEIGDGGQDAEPKPKKGGAERASIPQGELADIAVPRVPSNRRRRSRIWACGSSR